MPKHFATPGERNPGSLVLVNCTRACSLNIHNLPSGIGELVVKWFEDGDSIRAVAQRLQDLEIKRSAGAIGRHRLKHMEKRSGSLPREDQVKKKTDLEVLETIIFRGSQQVDLSASRISAEQLLRAIELKHKLTEGSVFDAMYEAMRGANVTDLDAPAKDEPAPPPDDPGLDIDKTDDSNEA